MHIRRSRYLRHRFPPEIISHAVWLYHRYLCLPEISSAACTLRIWRRPGSLRGHGNRVFRAVHRARVGPAEPGGASDRERRAAPSIGGLAATGSRATAVAASRHGCSGRGCVTCGPVGGTRSSSSSPTRSSAGIDEAFGSTGAGRVGRGGPGGPASRAPFKNSSARCAAPTRPGAPRASTASCSSSASRSLKPRSGTTWCVVGPRRPRPGAPS